jgi:hypothetical protein
MSLDIPEVSVARLSPKVLRGFYGNESLFLKQVRGAPVISHFTRQRWKRSIQEQPICLHGGKPGTTLHCGKYLRIGFGAMCRRREKDLKCSLRDSLDPERKR